MAIQTFGPNHWLISQSDIPAYFLYKLRKGQVGIYEEGERIATVTVGEGDQPQLLGFLAALHAGHRHRAAVKTDTEVEVESLYVEHVWGLLKHEVPAAMREDIERMTDAVVTADHIKSLRRRLERAAPIALEVPPDLDPDLIELLGELEALYQRLMSDSECRTQPERR